MDDGSTAAFALKKDGRHIVREICEIVGISHASSDNYTREGDPLVRQKCSTSGPHGVHTIHIKVGILIPQRSCFVETGLALRRELGHLAGIADVLSSLAVLARNHGDCSSPAGLLEEALDLIHDADDTLGCTWGSIHWVT